MLISKFMKELQSINPNWLTEANLDEEIYSYQSFPSSEELQNNILYIGCLSELKPDSGEGIINYLVIDDQKSAYDLDQLRIDYGDCNIILTPTPIQFQSLCKLASDIFLAEIKYTSYVNHMVIASNTNKGLSYLVDEAFKLIKCPIVIIDTSYKVLAMYNGLTIEARPDLDTQREVGYLTLQTLQRMKQDKIYETIRETKSPIYKKTDADPYGWLNVLVYIHGIEVAQIGMMEYDHPFTSYDYEFLNFFSQIVSWEMQKNDFYKVNRGVMHSVFLSELLDRKIPSQRIVAMRKEQLNWTDSPYLYVFTIFDNDLSDFNQKAQIIAYQIQHLLPNIRYVIYDTKLVILVSQSEEDTSIFNEDGPIEECLAPNQLIGVLSNCFSDLLEIRKYYDQTLKIFELKQIIPEHKFIYLYSDYMFYHIGQIISEKYDLKDFYHPAIMKMLQYDRENQSNFIQTLREYLLHIDNPTLCSKHLFIHKNTFFYRMNKIKELFHIDLSNGEERLKLQLTLEFLKLEELSQKTQKI